MDPIKERWTVGFNDRGLGHGDFAVMVKGEPSILAECKDVFESATPPLGMCITTGGEIAHYIVKLHNKEIAHG